ncbi:MAG TPA: SUMF1/EgtB/PvdO family nonheme iron enzyme [Polyangiaceae bacterium]|nr:SUMF1/EgtB/PvdO family nonheme iron enzyme [Polyangiaceae bacterium]
MMRTRCTVVLAAGLVGCLAGCGEEGKTTTKGELILALQTDMELPKDVDKVRIRVASYGSTIFSNDYQVGPSELKIPATLALIANPDHPSAPVTIQVMGFRQAKARVMRETVTTIPVERIASLRIPIEWLCDDSARTDNGEVVSTCPTEQTCIAGTCAESFVDSDELPDFKPADIFGGGDGSGNGVCFDVAQCFSSPIDLSVDMTTCRATLPSDEPNVNIALKPSAAGDGICSGGVCLIPLDSGEGGQWSRVTSGGDQGASVQLSRGICDRLQSGKIAAVIASKQCASKTFRVPPCGPWSAAGGSGSTSMDGGGGSGVDATTGTDSGGGIDSGSIDDGGVTPETGPVDDANTGIDAGPTFDARGGPESGTGPDGRCTLDNCGQPPLCQPPPAPTDGGGCMGLMSSPPPNSTSVCQWDVPGGIATTGMGFCANLLNLQLMNLPGMPGPTMLAQVGEGLCGSNPGWQFIPSQIVIELCPASCAPVKNGGVGVEFLYGCPTIGNSPDGGIVVNDGGPMPPDSTGPADATPPKDVSIDSDAGMAPMAPIIGGSFQMGCLPTDLACGTDESPYHSVDVSDFSIDETEVTQGAYDLCIRAGACVAPPCASWQPSTKANWPVACVNWTEASSYCNWTGRRLPTEAEWEIAARGATGFIYPWGNEIPDCSRANFFECSFASSQSVRSFAAGKSIYKIYDMAGNVGEWVFDWYGPYEVPPGPNPTGPPMGSQRVVRGGDYQSQSSTLRSSHRVAIDPNTRVDEIGFRCAKPGF